MALKNLVGTVARTGVSTAVAAVRDPRGTASQAVGLVKLTADTGLGLVRGHLGGNSAHAAEEETPAEKPTVEKPAAEQSPVEEPAPEKLERETTEPGKAEADDPRDHIPGPDLAAFTPPAPEDLPEPIVIEAE
jgi:hypothetical protein